MRHILTKASAVAARALAHVIVEVRDAISRIDKKRIAESERARWKIQLERQRREAIEAEKKEAELAEARAREKMQSLLRVREVGHQQPGPDIFKPLWKCRESVWVSFARGRCERDLGRLAKEGLIQAEQRPDGIYYSLTAEGHAALEQLLARFTASAHGATSA
jgi:hypothetical protein